MKFKLRTVSSLISRHHTINHSQYNSWKNIRSTFTKASIILEVLALLLTLFPTAIAWKCTVTRWRERFTYGTAAPSNKSIFFVKKFTFNATHWFWIFFLFFKYKTALQRKPLMTDEYRTKIVSRLESTRAG